MHLDVALLRSIGNRLYIVAALVYVAYLLSRSLLTNLVYSPELDRYNSTLAGVLQFIVTEIQAFTVPAVASVALILAFIVRTVVGAAVGDENESAE